jgi:metal-sulfur cluster biosynthetic enzyme
LLLVYHVRLMYEPCSRNSEPLGRAEIKVPWDTSEYLHGQHKKSYARKIRSSRLGSFNCVVDSYLNEEGKRLFPKEFESLVPTGKSFSYDVIWDVTRMHFIEYKQRLEIQKEMPFSISTGSISNLYKEGLAYFRGCHEAASPQLREYYQKELFVIQVDGTNEGGRYTHFQVRDSRTNNVLIARKIPTENTADIEVILYEVEQRYGRPAAVIADMSSAIMSAVSNIWDKQVPVFICQFHFLRDIGKDLLGKTHVNLQKTFSTCQITACLNTLRKSFVKNSIKHKKYEQDYLHGIALIDWILDYKSELKAEGYPFDLQWGKYYQRCLAAYKHIEKIHQHKERRYNQKQTKVLAQIQGHLSKVTTPITHRRRYHALKKDAEFFAEVRALFRQETNDNTAPLSRGAQINSQPQTDHQKMQQQIQAMANSIRQRAETMRPIRAKRYKKAAKQLEQYKKRLSNCIVIDQVVHPLPRTNNLCECSFREIKRQLRRTGGRKNLSQVLDYTPAEIMLLHNLKDPEYRAIVFQEKEIHEAFAQISQSTIKAILDKMNSQSEKKIIDPSIRKVNFLALSKKFYLQTVA